MLSDIANCLNELDKIMYEGVDVGYIVRSLEDIREYIELYSKQEDKKFVFETINYLLGHIKKDYIKNNDLSQYRILRMLLLNCHWKPFDIKPPEYNCEDNENVIGDCSE